LSSRFALRYLHSLPTRRSSDLEQLQHVLLDVDVEVNRLLATDLLAGDFHVHAEHQRTVGPVVGRGAQHVELEVSQRAEQDVHAADRKSTRLNSSHVKISYAVYC